jgi:chromosome segregation ATPase
VSSPDPEQTGFTESQRAGIERRRFDQDRTLDAMQELEQALGAAAPRREAEWRREVLASLTVLDEAAREEAANASRPDSLLSDISRTQPWLRNRVRALRAHYDQLQHRIGELRGELETPAAGLGDASVDVAAVRRRLASVLTALRQQRARESDLIYEAYYDAFHVDLAPRQQGGAE